MEKWGNCGVSGAEMICFEGDLKHSMGGKKMGGGISWLTKKSIILNIRGKKDWN